MGIKISKLSGSNTRGKGKEKKGNKILFFILQGKLLKENLNLYVLGFSIVYLIKKATNIYDHTTQAPKKGRSPTLENDHLQ